MIPGLARSQSDHDAALPSESNASDPCRYCQPDSCLVCGDYESDHDANADHEWESPSRICEDCASDFASEDRQQRERDGD